MNSNVYPLKNTNSHYLLLNTTIIPLCNGKISLIFFEGPSVIQQCQSNTLDQQDSKKLHSSSQEPDHKICDFLQAFVRSIKGTFKKYVCSRFPSFDLPPPPFLFVLRFRAPLIPPKVCLFWLELPLSPSNFILTKFREKKLIMRVSTSIFELNVSFKKPQWNLYKMDIRCMTSVRFVEMSTLQRVHLKIRSLQK